MENISNKKILPDYYGGAYIDDFTGKLVVLICDDDLNKANYSTNLYNEQIIKRSTKISLNEMYQTIAILSQNLEFLETQGVDIIEVSDDIMKGKVNIKIKNLNKEKEMIVRNVINKNYLFFSEGLNTYDETMVTKNSVEQQNLIGLSSGYRIDKALGSYWEKSTIGFPARRGTVDGFVVTGHSFNQLNLSAYHDGIHVGTVTKTAFYNGSKADAAFIAKTTNAEILPTMRNGGYIMGTINPIVNLSICMYGDTSKLQNGKIISLNATVQSSTDTSVWFYEQGVADYNSQGGDSGAPVMLYEGNYGGSAYSMVGMHRSSSSSGKHFSTIKNIKDELGVICLTK